MPHDMGREYSLWQCFYDLTCPNKACFLSSSFPCCPTQNTGTFLTDDSNFIFCLVSETLFKSESGYKKVAKVSELFLCMNIYSYLYSELMCIRKNLCLNWCQFFPLLNVRIHTWFWTRVQKWMSWQQKSQIDWILKSGDSVDVVHSIILSKISWNWHSRSKKDSSFLKLQSQMNNSGQTLSIIGSDNILWCYKNRKGQKALESWSTGEIFVAESGGPFFPPTLNWPKGPGRPTPPQRLTDCLKRTVRSIKWAAWLIGIREYGH